MENAYKFFLLFAQTECALKMLGFHNGNDKEAKANWDRFVNTISPYFDFENSRISDSVSYLENNPPKKQWIVDNKLCWISVNKTGKRLHDLFLSIRRVRNNLFHGGKFNGIYFESPKRSNELFDNCIEIITYCREIYPSINPNG